MICQAMINTVEKTKHNIEGGVTIYMKYSGKDSLKEKNDI